ncbi:MAG: ergothioneine biosynthesis protein EgtB [Planctomycetia bacterium]|nr:ergothioneine biosynthesis protein EgtB [Planctomycetia bacterium]
MTTDLTEPAATRHDPGLSRHELADRYRLVRGTTERLCSPLEIEDYVVQSMPDASPAKWHLAHTSWFFETFVLKPSHEGRGVSPGEYAFLFNSYYNALGERIARGRRGLLTRPTVAQVYQYRARVDEEVSALLESADEAALARLAPLLTLGSHHEQQHQELILTDLKHLFGSSPVRPAYLERTPDAASDGPPLRWLDYPGGLGEIGHEGGDFAFDNESPRHRVFAEPYRLASRPVTNGEYLGFLNDGGYDRPEFWLSDGWNARQAQGWTAPLYWRKDGEAWRVFTLTGEHELVAGGPVCHVSFYEADAFARWAGARLPTEAEWELAAGPVPVRGNFLEDERYHPRPAAASGSSGAAPSPLQLFGDVWEWTGSPYVPYPGYRPAPGALGEYNGKFMCNQMVLRGGSCATPRSHVRPTYRNFFPPDARWQFSGLRLARDGR